VWASQKPQFLKRQQFGFADELSRESDKFWTKSALAHWKRFSGSGSTDRSNTLHCIALHGIAWHCIALHGIALQQMESTQNEVNNGPLSYF
jgi:hypothetical protein